MNALSFFQMLNGYLWGPPMLVLLFGTHLFLTVRTGFVQRKLGAALRIAFSKEKGEGDVSQFGALATALAATIGTGNIVGVATAVALGGPGAVLWIWLTGVFGIATKYGEALLAVKFRVKDEVGQMQGGPMYALERGLNMKWLGVIFAVFTALAAFGIGNMVQSNSIAHLVSTKLSIAPWITGIVLAFITAIVILGGVRSIAAACTALVPFMAVFYVAGCIVILVINRDFLLPACSSILVEAFRPKAVGGGVLGAGILMAMRYGIARGLFSNESGLGSAPIVAAAAKTRNPVRQALVSSTGTFFDTVIICALTGLVVVSSIVKNKAAFVGLNGAALTSKVFEAIPVVGPIVLGVGLFTFVYSTILGWSYYGERAVEYLFGRRSVLPYRFLWIIGVFAGAVMSLPLVWEAADAMNALMAIPNLVALLLLSGLIAKETRYYLWGNRLDNAMVDDVDKALRVRPAGKRRAHAS
ncbi:MAG: sodium:alanine symporter family protein [Spirochaetota bacterium]